VQRAVAVSTVSGVLGSRAVRQQVQKVAVAGCDAKKGPRRRGVRQDCAAEVPTGNDGYNGKLT
jgi:hypothetical protein